MKVKHDAPNTLLTYRERLSLAARLVVIALICLVANACSCPRLSAPSPRDVLVDEYARTVKIAVKCKEGNEVGGTGVRVGGTAVLTAFHVVSCAIDSITVTDQDTNEYPATLEAASDADIARLDVPSMTPMPSVRIGAVEVGDRACAAVFLPQRGRRCGETWPGDGTNGAGSVHIDFVAEHGNSGSGVWNERGELVGILVHLRYCLGTENPQVCGAGVTPLALRSWLAAR